jgi:hypothetical protein
MERLLIRPLQGRNVRFLGDTGGGFAHHETPCRQASKFDAGHGLCPGAFAGKGWRRQRDQQGPRRMEQNSIESSHSHYGSDLVTAADRS